MHDVWEPWHVVNFSDVIVGSCECATSVCGYIGGWTAGGREGWIIFRWSTGGTHGQTNGRRDRCTDGYIYIFVHTYTHLKPIYIYINMNRIRICNDLYLQLFM